MILPSGNRVVHFERIDSTNAEAQRLAAGGERGPIWLLADEQTHGRGRLGRSWMSEPGNLYATFVFSIAGGPEVAAQVSFIAALAVHDLVAALLPNSRACIKWPNDVLIGGAKICGLLAEVVAQSPVTIALGCGFNVTHAPAATPYPVTSLADHGLSTSVESVFQELDARFLNRLNIWNEGRGFSTIRSDWQAHACGIGEAAEAVIGNQPVRGTFHGLADDGALILELPDATHRHIHSGEVRFATIDAMRKATG